MMKILDDQSNIYCILYLTGNLKQAKTAHLLKISRSTSNMPFYLVRFPNPLDIGSSQAGTLSTFTMQMIMMVKVMMIMIVIMMIMIVIMMIIIIVIMMTTIVLMMMVFTSLLQYMEGGGCPLA